MKIAVTGANSSVGQNLLAHVAEGGGDVSGEVSVIAGVRSESAFDSLPRSPRISARRISYDDVDGLAKTIAGATCVVHLAGILIESRATKYTSANVDATAAVVDAARKAGVQHMVLVSVLHADPDSRNRFLESKGEAERLVAESGMSSTIIRTPILLGPGTAGAEALLRTATRSRAPLLGGGHYMMSPLDVDDLSRAILRACETRPEGVSTHELVGPESLPFRDLVTRFAGMLGGSISIGSIPIWFAKVGPAIASRLTGGGISPTVIDVITADEVVERNADADLGISLTPLSVTLEKILPEGTQQTGEHSN